MNTEKENDILSFKTDEGKKVVERCYLIGSEDSMTGMVQ